jgi:energy-converting hydrogenase Eha subunit A
VPQELYAELIQRLARVRARRERIDRASALTHTLSALLLIGVIAIGNEAIFHLSIAGRTILFCAAFAAFAGIAIRLLSSPLAILFGMKPRLSDDELASRIGGHFAVVSDKLLNTLQLARPVFTRSSELIGSPALAIAAFNSTYEPTRSLNFEAIVEDRPLKRAFLLFFLSIIGCGGILLGFHSEMAGATTRLAHFRTFYQKPAPFVFEIKPGNVRVMRGDSVHIMISTTGEQLKRITLRFREEGQKEFDTLGIESQQLLSSSGPLNNERVFHYDARVQHPMEYYAESREIESEHFTISVLDHPIVRNLVVRVVPPSYTREKSQNLNENFGDITGVTGTKAEFRILASKALRSAKLVFQPTATSDTSAKSTSSKPPEKTFDLSVADTIASGAVTFMQSGSYHIELTDTDAITSEHPIEYTVSITRDELPTIALVEPNDRADLPNNLRLDMLARIHDDFGFRGVKLGYRLTKSKFGPAEKEYHWLDVPLANYNTQDLDVPYIWNLTPLELAPEDEVGYVLEVSDNDAVTGPKKARTGEFTVRYPSVKEIFERANQEESKAEKDLNEIKQDASELKKKVDEAVDELRQSKSSNMAKDQQEFSKQKDVQQILERQKQLDDRVQDVAKDLQQMTDQLQKQQALSPETMQKYADLQKLFQQIQSPELKKAMDQLQQAMQNVDPKQLQEAMKNVQFNEDNFKKSLERTTNILKRIQLEQKIDEMTKRTGELAKQEEHASEDHKNAAKNPKSQTPQDKAQAQRQQQDAQKELDRLQKEAQDLANNMKKLPEKMQAPQEMKDAQEALADPKNQKSMEDAEEASEQGDEDRASERSKDAASQMKQAQRKMQKLKQKLSENEKERTKRELRQIRDELNRLSKDEESIKDAAQQAQPNSNVFRDLANQQAEKKDELGQTASKAMELAQRSTAVTPEMGKSMGEAFNQMQHGEDAMTERDQNGSDASSQGAMAALNKAAQQTEQAMEGMGKGKGKSPGQGEGQSDQPGEDPGGDSPGDNPGDEGEGGQQGGGSAMQQFLGAINKLTAQQKALNDMMSGMQGQGGAQAAKNAMEQQAQLSKMAAQQEAVKKSIEDLAHEQQESQQGTSKATEDLKKIADDMQQAINEMRSSGVKPETIQRQERILSKLLEAQQSVHERDKDQARESKPGENTTRESPKALDINTPDGKKQLEDELTRVRETGYSKDYEALIRKYFDALQKTKQ